MGILGKILLVLNILIGGGFAYLAVQDWQGRQAITAAGLRHIILLHGLPLGDLPGTPDTTPTDPEAEIPFVVEGPGGKPTETVSLDLLKTYFKAAADAGKATGPALASADPVHSQLAEVRRVYDLVKAYVEAQPAGAGRAKAAHDFLLLQAETLDDRKDAQRLLAANKGDELAAKLYARFDRVLKKPEKGDTSAIDAGGADDDADKAKARLGKAGELRDAGTKDEPERRARLAHLLVHLDQSAAWQKRVLMVVGVKQYARTAGLQAARFVEMTTRVLRLLDDEEARFRDEYASLLKTASDRSQILRDRQDREELLARIEKSDATAVAELRTRLDDPINGLKAQLAQVKTSVDELLAKQNVTEKKLYDLQKQVGIALDDIYRMEVELRIAEQAKYGKK